MKELKEKYLLSMSKYKQKRKEIDDKLTSAYEALEKAEHKIARLEAKADKIKRPSQHDVIRELAKKISVELGNLPYDIFGPFGLCAQTSIYLKDTDGGKYVLRLRPYDGPAEWLTYDTGKMRTDNICPPGSIGELNGMNILYDPLPDDFEEIMKIVKASKYYPSGNCNV